MKKALFITDRFDEIYTPELYGRVEELVDLVAPPQRCDAVMNSPELLHEVEIIMSGWLGPKLDEKFLNAAPKLEGFFYAGGCTQSIVTPECWSRGIVISSAIMANSVPVAEYTLAQVILCLKQTYQATNAFWKDRACTYSLREVAGGYKGKVGLIGLGNIASILLKLLKNLEVEVLIYDPVKDPRMIKGLGAKSVSLETVFSECDVVSLHAPVLPSTEGMITEKLLSSMKKGASFINTARGILVREEELIRALRSRPDLFAILDVTDPEPPRSDSELWTLPNIMLTPHIAGSQGFERYRVGRMMVEELKRYVSNEPLECQLKSPFQHTNEA